MEKRGKGGGGMNQGNTSWTVLGLPHLHVPIWYTLNRVGRRIGLHKQVLRNKKGSEGKNIIFRALPVLTRRQVGTSSPGAAPGLPREGRLWEGEGDRGGRGLGQDGSLEQVGQRRLCVLQPITVQLILVLFHGPGHS